MNTRQTMTAASMPITLGGKELAFSPLTDKDIAELDNWVRTEYIKMARDSLDTVDEPALRAETIKSAMDTAAGLTWMSGQGAQMMQTVNGMSRLCFQSVRRGDPTVTHEWLREQLLDHRNVAEVRRAFEMANNIATDDASPPEEEDLVQLTPGERKRRERRAAKKKKNKKQAGRKRTGR